MILGLVGTISSITLSAAVFTVPLCNIVDTNLVTIINMYKKNLSAENVQKGTEVKMINLLEKYNIIWNDSSRLIDEYGNKVDNSFVYKTSEDTASQKYRITYTDRNQEKIFCLYDNRVLKNFKGSITSASVDNPWWGNNYFDMTANLMKWFNEIRIRELPRNYVKGNTDGHIEAHYQYGKPYGKKTYLANKGLHNFINKIIDKKANLKLVLAQNTYYAFRGDVVHVKLVNSLNETYNVVNHNFGILYTGVGASYNFWTNPFSYYAVV